MEIGFIGAGKVGRALGLYFKQYGLTLSGYYSKTKASACAAAEITNSTAFSSIEELVSECNVIFITTPDLALSVIDATVAALIKSLTIPASNCWIHVSGALSSDHLCHIKAAGCEVGSMHPLQSFSSATESVKSLDQTLFSIEGTEKAVDIIRSILEKTGAKNCLLSSAQKPLYHAGACVLSNYLVTLLESGIRYFEAVGINRAFAFEAVKPLVQATLSNVFEQGTVKALTGPIVRGDYNTLDIHLQALALQLPSELELYKTMASNTIALIANERITEQQQESLLRSLRRASCHGG